MPADLLKALGLPEEAVAKLAQTQQQPSQGAIPSQLTAHEVEVITAIERRFEAAAERADSRTAAT